MVAFVPVVILAPALSIAMFALICLILVLGYFVIIKPAVDWVFDDSPGFLGRAIRWVARPAVSALDRFVQHHIELLSRSFVSGIPPLVTIVNQLAVLVQHTYGTLDDMATQILQALQILRHETIPNEIEKAVKPLVTTITKHTTRLNTLEHLNSQVAQVIGNGLRALPWGVPGTYVGNFAAWWKTYEKLWDQVFSHLTPQLNTLRTQTVPQLRRDLNAVIGSLGQLTTEVGGQVDSRLDRLENAVNLELRPTVNSLVQSVNALYAAVSGQVATEFVQLFGRVGQLETQLQAIVTGTLQPLEQRVGQLETTVQTTLTTAVQTITQRLTTVETQLQTLVGTTTATIAQRVTDLETQVSRIVLDIPGEITIGIATVTQRVTDLETYVRTQLEPRITAIEKLLVPAALAATVVAIMRTAFPNLFCRNTTSVTQRLCQLDENLIADLLAGTLVFAVVLDPRIIAESGQALTGAMSDLWRATAQL